MPKKKPTFICPYCFDEHELSKVQFRCSNKNCGDVPDVEMTRYEKGNLSIPKSGKICFGISAEKNKPLPKFADCPRCGQRTYKMVCPSCHNTLPESTMTGRNMIISIVGSRDTGKSHFIGVIINEMINRIAGKFDGAMEAFDDTMKRYEESFGKRLYVDLQKLELTQSSEINVDNGAYRPLIFMLKFKSTVLFREIVESFTFVFFDTAGEDLNDLDTMSTVNKYICKSVGIIFLLDPTKIPAVANQLDDAVIAQASSVDMRQTAGSDDIIARISKLIRRDKNMDSSQQIKMPVAAVFSKFDVIESIVRAGNPGSTILNTSPHCSLKAFDMSDWHNVNTEIQSLLKGWNADSFMMQLAVNYRTYSYFTVSALGLDNNPSMDKGIKRPTPHRIEDPLLWILKENGVIPCKSSSFSFQEMMRSGKRRYDRLASVVDFKLLGKVCIVAAVLLLVFLTRHQTLPLVQSANTSFAEWRTERAVARAEEKARKEAEEQARQEAAASSDDSESKSTLVIRFPANDQQNSATPTPTPIPTPTPTPTPEPSPPAIEYAEDYILPYSDTRELKDSDLRDLSKEELRLARNEIYARHGRVFRDNELQKYFDSKPWYQSLKKLPLGTEPTLTELEILNIVRIIAYE